MRKHLSPRVWDAIEYAVRVHAGQYRKGTRVPYIVHPLAVGQILIEHDLPQPVVIAGILHDVIEDTPVTAAQLRRRYGREVTRLVLGATEPDRSLSWEERKRHTIEYLRVAPLDIACVSCADKLDNVRSILKDREVMGDAVFKRFNRPKSQQQWYYGGIAQALMKRSGATHTTAKKLFRLYAATVEKLFKA